MSPKWDDILPFPASLKHPALMTSDPTVATPAGGKDGQAVGSWKVIPRLSRPQPGTPAIAARMLLAILIPSSIVTVLGGQSAGMAFGIAAGFVMAVTPSTTNPGALWSAGIAAALAAVSNVAGHTPWAIAALMILASILMAAMNLRSAGLMALAPIIVIVFGPGPIHLSWWQAAIWTALGGFVGLAVTRWLGFQAPLRPIPRRIVWPHALVLGCMSAVAMYWALSTGIPHAYWVAVTIVVALRPLPEERKDTLVGRLAGTIGGAVIALVVVFTLPAWGAAIVATVCLYLLATYAMGGSYFMQTLFLTPMLLLFASLGDGSKGFTLTMERVFYTLVGALCTVIAVIALDWWDRRSAPDPIHVSF